MTPSVWRTAYALLGIAVLVLVFSPDVPAGGVVFKTGDVLAGVGFGKIKHFSPDGALLDTLDTGTNCPFQTGMAFKPGGHLLATLFDCRQVVEFDNLGNRVGSFGGPYGGSTESIVIDSAGNVYVGQVDRSTQVLKFSPAGALIDAYSPQVQARGTDWIDLAADQCTLRYTSEGSSIKSFDVCTKTQLADFATGLSSPCYAHRIRRNFEELVACTSRVYRLNGSGGIIQTYVLPGASTLFALNLDPDDKTFWTGDFFSGRVFRVDIATGAIVTQFNAPPLTCLCGLAIVGEITAATKVPPSTTSYYVALPSTALVDHSTVRDSDTLHGLGVRLAQSQAASGGTRDSVVALLFGAPTLDPVTQEYGAIFGKRRRSISAIEALVEDFASGYYNALGTNRTAHVRIIIATSNSGRNVTFNHGRAWAQMVNEVTTWVIVSGYAGQVDIAGGTDIELGFNSFAVTRQWVDGFASVTPQRFMYNVGAAEGCPPSGNCNNGWTQDNVWYVSWGSPPAQALPEVYNATNARQWATLSLYGLQHHNESIIIAGALTELGACGQYPTDPTCRSPFTPAQGWQNLNDQLTNLGVAQTLPWSTDIIWCDNSHVNCL